MGSLNVTSISQGGGLNFSDGVQVYKFGGGMRVENFESSHYDHRYTLKNVSGSISADLSIYVPMQVLAVTFNLHACIKELE